MIIEFKERARKLRKNLPDAEQIMWFYLRKKRFLGLRFRRQVLIGNYIVDFVCLPEKLIIEIDGGQHNDAAEYKYDQRRTKFLVEQGYTVLRYWNDEVCTEIDTILDDIYLTIASSLASSVGEAGCEAD